MSRLDESGEEGRERQGDGDGHGSRAGAGAGVGAGVGTGSGAGTDAGAGAGAVSEPAPQVDDGARVSRIERFTRAERYIHRATAILMVTLIVTGAVLYLPSLSVRIGHRQFIALIHLYSGWSLPIPMAAGLFSKAYRADVRRLSRHNETDRTWLKKRAWRPERAHELALPVGKFNAGQKLNAAFQCGAILVMTGTGTLMWFPHLVGLSMRTGATFVHDWLALAIGFVVIGHVWFALNDRQARAGMRTGWVTRRWAEQEHRAWAAETAADAGREAVDRAARGEAGPREVGGTVH